MASVKYVINGPAAGESSWAPKDWTFEGSNDDSNWDILDTVTGQTAWGALEERAFTFSNTTKYRYYRLNVSDNDGGTRVSITEMAIHVNQQMIVDITNEDAGFGGFGSDYTLKTNNGMLDIIGDIGNRRGKITTAGTQLIMEQTGAIYGTARLTLAGETGFTGAKFEVTGINVLDFIFTHTGGTRNIRLEGRSANTKMGTAQEWQFGAVGVPHFVASDAGANIRIGKFGVNQPAPLGMIDVIINGATVIGQIIKLAASQSANAFEVRTSADALLANITPTGGALFSDKVIFTQVDGNEYIDSLADGYMDYGATTAHRFNNNIEIADAKNFVLNTTTGSQLGASDTAKLAMYAATPIVRQNHIIDAPGDTTANNATTINAILVALENFGIIKTA